MPKENERKFLVKDLSVLDGLPGSHIRQRYLEETPVEVRIYRTADEAAIVLATPDNRACNWTHIPFQDADELIAKYAPGGLLDKSRVVVRVRMEHTAGCQKITIKGPTQDNSRDEYEYPMLSDHASYWMGYENGHIIEKTRFRIPVDGFVFEVDKFHGPLETLYLAEVEYEGDGSGIPLPDWLGDEVSDDPQYFNSNLVKATQPPVRSVTK
jgi:CYTH domain-containing protein